MMVKWNLYAIVINASNGNLTRIMVGIEFEPKI